MILRSFSLSYGLAITLLVLANNFAVFEVVTFAVIIAYSFYVAFWSRRLEDVKFHGLVLLLVYKASLSALLFRCGAATAIHIYFHFGNFIFPLLGATFRGTRLALSMAAYIIVETIVLYGISPAESADHFGLLDLSPEQYLFVRVVVEINLTILSTVFGISFHLYASKVITTLAEMSEVRRRFISNMNHEIRTPLVGVLGMAELLLAEEQLSPSLRSKLEVIASSGEALLHLVNNILDLSRIEAQAVVLEHRAVDVGQLVSGVLGMFEASALAKGLQMIAHFEPGIPGQIMTDPYRLMQVLNNLVGNAIKFTERGRVTVTVDVLDALWQDEEEASAAQGAQHHHLPLQQGPSLDAATSAVPGQRYISFSVKDTGIGVARGDGIILFQPFSQADTSTTRRYGGSGLGLALCADIARLMGGKVRLVRGDAPGAEFQFALPIILPEDGEGEALPLGEGGEQLFFGSESATSDSPQIGSARGSNGSDATWHRRVVSDRVGSEESLASARSQRAAAAAAGAHQHHVAAISSSAGSGAWQRTLSASDASPASGRRSTRLQAKAQAQAGAHMAPSVSARVLVADDNPVNALVMQRQMERIGYSYTIVGSGGEAVDAYLSDDGHTYDVIILDLDMPGMDGLQAARAIRQAEMDGGSGRRVPIVGLSAADPDIATECRRAGMDDALVKPLNMAALKECVERYLKPKRL